MEATQAASAEGSVKVRTLGPCYRSFYSMWLIQPQGLSLRRILLRRRAHMGRYVYIAAGVTEVGEVCWLVLGGRIRCPSLTSVRALLTLHVASREKSRLVRMFLVQLQHDEPQVYVLYLDTEHVTTRSPASENS